MREADFSQIEFTDRYQAAGIPYPSPDTVCTGQCEGMGCYPQRGDDPTSTPAERAAWEAEHAKVHRIGFRVRAAVTWTFLSWRSRLGILLDKCDGTHFIKCPDCNGTGKRPVVQIP